jgi:hypothetical protein
MRPFRGSSRPAAFAYCPIRFKDAIQFAYIKAEQNGPRNWTMMDMMDDDIAHTFVSTAVDQPNAREYAGTPEE